MTCFYNKVGNVIVVPMFSVCFWGMGFPLSLIRCVNAVLVRVISETVIIIIIIIIIVFNINGYCWTVSYIQHIIKYNHLIKLLNSHIFRDGMKTCCCNFLIQVLVILSPLLVVLLMSLHCVSGLAFPGNFVMDSNTSLMSGCMSVQG